MQNIKLIAVASALIASLALTGCDKAKEAQATTDASQSKADVTAPVAEPQDGKTPDQLAAHPAQPESPANTQPADAAKTK